MKVTLVTKHRQKTADKLVTKTDTAVVAVKFASQIAKAAAYVQTRHAQFSENVGLARRHLKEPENGVLAGPLTRC